MHKAGQHVAVGASLGPRGDVKELGRRRDRAEVLVHRNRGNGGRRSGVRMWGREEFLLYARVRLRGHASVAAKERRS
jgi:hypothetical protein